MTQIAPSTLVRVTDKEINSFNGFVALAIHGLLTLLLVGAAVMMGGVGGIILGVLTVVTSLFFLGGYFILEPNQVAVHTFFGDYVGTVKTTGMRWNNPLFSTRKVVQRVLNFESKNLKVNDLDGNPIHISAVIVWRVRDAASALFSVNGFTDFISTQTESALRTLATGYSYDSHDKESEGIVSLRESQDEISTRLREELQDRVAIAGLEVIEARLNELAYAPEIAGAMLQRQQAQAVVAAREQIVKGAVGMVKSALEQLDDENIVDLDDERKAQMVSNLLVVLCGDRSVSPMINAGSIHS